MQSNLFENSGDDNSTSKKYYIVYKTINEINGKYYIGAHSTNNLNDGYFGSGLLLKRALKKYGKENFTRKILFQCENEHEMFIKESELISEIDIDDQSCYNLIEGGKGWIGLGEFVVEEKIGIHSLSFEERSKISKKVQENRDYFERIEMCSKGGKKGGKISTSNKSGIHGLSKEKRIINAKKGNEATKQKGVGRFNSDTQRNLGKRGGPNNKGFKYYNDGVNVFKYTRKQQEVESFEDFLLNNPNFKAGRGSPSVWKSNNKIDLGE